MQPGATFELNVELLKVVPPQWKWACFVLWEVRGNWISHLHPVFFFFLIFLFIYGFDNLIAATTFLLETVIVLANDSFVWRSIVSPRA